MNTRKFLLVVALLSGVCIQTDAQSLFKKLKQKAAEAFTGNGNPEISTSQKTGTLGPDADDCVGADNPALKVNTELKREFYTSDVVVEMLNEENKKTISYFDAEALAMKTIQPGSPDRASYMDSEGFFYGFNKDKGYYEKSGIMNMGAMDMMGPSIMVTQYKLPTNPFFEKQQYLHDKNVKAFPFLYLEFTFLYKPEDFRGEGYGEVDYGQPGYSQFYPTSPGYEGSYVVFDDQHRLIEINIMVNTEQFKGTGYIKYAYKPTTVCLPEAKEVKMPFQGLMEKAMNPGKN